MIDWNQDPRTVLTLDAGGTNFVFSALTGGEISVPPVYRSSSPDNAEETLELICDGFEEVIHSCLEKPSAISFAFPGPADYPNGIIGNLPNFPGFTAPVPLGAHLKKRFKIPVYINNDGNLFALGEWHSGFLPKVNRLLSEEGSSKIYRNLLGITIGTGLGAGVVINGRMLIGDNSIGGELWCTRNSRLPGYCAEASVGRKSLGYLYNSFARREKSALLEPSEIYEIGCGLKEGDRDAAIEAFASLGDTLGNAVADALSLIDGLVVIGGGISKAYDLFAPSFFSVLKGNLKHSSGKEIHRIQSRVYDMESKDEMEDFISFVCQREMTNTPVGSSGLTHATGVGISVLGTSAAVSLGAYIFALEQLSERGQGY